MQYVLRQMNQAPNQSGAVESHPTKAAEVASATKLTDFANGPPRIAAGLETAHNCVRDFTFPSAT